MNENAVADPRIKTEQIEIGIFVCLLVLNRDNREGEIK